MNLGQQVPNPTIQVAVESAGRYRIRITYAGNRTEVGISCVADEEWEVHGFRAKEFPIRPAEFSVAPQATADGELILTWQKEEGGGGPGRGLEIAEVWLPREP